MIAVPMANNAARHHDEEPHDACDRRFVIIADSCEPDGFDAAIRFDLTT